MASNAPKSKLSLPKPESAKLEAFSLFERETSIKTDFAAAPVFCLVGANGLGKSTFLSALSYGITGAVAEPGRPFRGVSEYYKSAKAYAPKYFRGRIADPDRDAAQISITMRVGSRRYELTRPIFEGNSLRALSITDAEGGAVVVETDGLDDDELQAIYVRELTNDVGLDTFAQLVFLQLFILSFDERRELLFWTPKLLQQALYITFDLDPTRAREADRLSKRVEGLESLARNAQWQATKLRGNIELLEATGEEVLEESGDASEQEKLEELRDEAALSCGAAERALADAHLELAERSSMLQALRADYEVIWTERLQGNGHPGSHPLVAATLESHHCAVCGTEGEAVVEQITSSLEAKHCPLCQTEFSSNSKAEPAKVLDRLAELDEEIAETQRSIADLAPRIDELEQELGSSREELRNATAALADIEQRNQLAISTASDPGSSLKAVVDRFRVQIADFHKERDEKRRERDRVRRELQPLQESLVLSYRTAEQEFVPSFNELATEFLGLELDIAIEQHKDTVGLALRVEGTERRDVDTLSESQRFFVDIALRMALIQQMSSSEGPGCLLVDTPEGSLDIAYESRAGEMFGLFVERGHQLIMAANINTSQLLQRLAKRCGSKGLVLERMTEWTNLSSVQIAEEQSFERAWQEIRASLNPSGRKVKAKKGKAKKR